MCSNGVPSSARICCRSGAAAPPGRPADELGERVRHHRLDDENVVEHLVQQRHVARERDGYVRHVDSKRMRSLSSLIEVPLTEGDVDDAA